MAYYRTLNKHKFLFKSRFELLRLISGYEYPQTKTNCSNSWSRSVNAKAPVVFTNILLHEPCYSRKYYKWFSLHKCNVKIKTRVLTGVPGYHSPLNLPWSISVLDVRFAPDLSFSFRVQDVRFAPGFPQKPSVCWITDSRLIPLKTSAWRI